MDLSGRNGKWTSARLTGWGGGPAVATRLLRPSRLSDLNLAGIPRPVIARGGGRSYGDSAVSPGITIDMTRCDRLLSHDLQNHMVVAESGLRLGDLMRFALARGQCPPVIPGTQSVTLGGMIAADVHGKNHHHAGNLRQHLSWIDLLQSDGTVVRLLPGERRFDMTCGGMGLTGVILRAALRLSRVETGYLRQTTRRATDLGELLSALREAEAQAYSVAWLDALAPGRALGRGVIQSADHLPLSDLPGHLAKDPFALSRHGHLTLPRLPVPVAGLFRWPHSAANALKFRAAPANETIVRWDRFFFPLDVAHNWNRLYGKRGFVQIHVLIPEGRAESVIAELLTRLAREGHIVTLAVVKRMANLDKDVGLAFGDGGISLAIDLPRTRRLLRMADGLMSWLVQAGGRFYLAKDSLLTAGGLVTSDPRASAFAAWRKEAGLAGEFVSAQSARLAL